MVLANQPGDAKTVCSISMRNEFFSLIMNNLQIGCDNVIATTKGVKLSNSKEMVKISLT